MLKQVVLEIISTCRPSFAQCFTAQTSVLKQLFFLSPVICAELQCPNEFWFGKCLSVVRHLCNALVPEQMIWKCCLSAVRYL